MNLESIKTFFSNLWDTTISYSTKGWNVTEDFVAGVKILQEPEYQVALHSAALLLLTLTVVYFVKSKRRLPGPSKKKTIWQKTNPSVTHLLAALEKVPTDSWKFTFANDKDLHTSSLEAYVKLEGFNLYIISVMKKKKYIRQELYKEDIPVLMSAEQKTKLRNLVVTKAKEK